MKRRVRKIANFFAFNLLFFALYLNFIHKDKSTVVVTGVAQTTTPQNKAAFSGTVTAGNTQEMQKNSNTALGSTEKVTQSSTALKLSIN
ncbi:MAG: hypothetical protein ABIR30_14000 [Chitinophagaceae bacterium]